MVDIKFIPNHNILKCWSCNGKGCNVCKNGMFKEESYYAIYTNKKGKKIAFQVDGLK